MCQVWKKLEKIPSHLQLDIYSDRYLDNVESISWLMWYLFEVLGLDIPYYDVYTISNIRRTNSHLPLPSLLKPGVKSMMSALLQVHLSDQQFDCLLRCGLY